jgi:hypothetical protein
MGVIEELSISTLSIVGSFKMLTIMALNIKIKNAALIMK